MQICKYTDKVIIEMFKKISNDIYSQETFETCVSIFTIDGKNTNDIKLNEISSNILSLFNSTPICTNKIILRIKRKTSATTSDKGEVVSTTTIERNSFFDTLTMKHESSISEEMRLDAIALTLSQFQESSYSENISKVLGPELSEFYKKREESLLRLEGINQNLIEANEEHKDNLENRYSDKEKKLVEKYTQKEAFLQDELVKERELLKNEKEKLDAEWKKIDDLDNTASRRKLREDLKSELQKRSEKFTLSKETIDKRIPIKNLFLFLIIFFLAFTVYNLFTIPRPIIATKTNVIPTNEPLIVELDSTKVNNNVVRKENMRDIVNEEFLIRNPNAYITFVLRLIMSSLGLVFSLIYNIRWNDKWAKAHADEEFKLKRLALDIDRASWVVETALEWDNATTGEQQIPEHLLDRISFNLFVDERDTECATHPTEDILTKIFGASSTVNVKTPFVEAQLDRRGVKKAIKEVKKATEN